MVIFPFFKMAAGGHLGFLNSGNINGWLYVQGGWWAKCITTLNFVNIGPMVAEISRFFDFFLNGGRPPSWISLPRFWITTEK